MNLSLDDSYRAVSGQKTGLDDFLVKDLDVSNSLFELDAFDLIRPRKLEVLACVAGLTFPSYVVDHLSLLQDRIRNLLPQGLRAYFVEPHNLALELVVLKWPTDVIRPDVLLSFYKFLPGLLPPNKIQIDIRGFQFHRDGCLIAKGFDTDNSFRCLRDNLIKKIPQLPTRQSNWAHIPLGRILEPIGTESYALLRELEVQSQGISLSFSISELKLIHEHRWYMVERDTLARFHIGSL